MWKKRLIASSSFAVRKGARLRTQILGLLRQSVSAARCSGLLPPGRSTASNFKLVAFRVFSERRKMATLPEVVFVLGGPGSGKGTLCISISEVSTGLDQNRRISDFCVEDLKGITAD